MSQSHTTKKTLFRYLFGVTIFAAKLSFAANGPNLIGVSAASRAMGGVGVGGGTSIAESFYKNPAVLSSIPLKEATVASEAALIFLGLNTTTNLGSGVQSQTGNTVSPTLAGAYRQGDLTLGLATFGNSGVAVDYRDNFAANGIVTKYRAVRTAVGASYQLTPTVALGVEPFLTYSELALTTIFPANSKSPHGALGVGIQAGLLVKVIENMTAGLSFMSGSRVTHKSITDLDAFGGAPDGIVDPFTVSTPMELSLGVNYKGIENLELGIDYRYVDLKHAAGYSDFQWNSIHVISIGSAYKMDKLALRTGFSYSPSPIPNGTGEAGTATVQGKTVLKSAQSTLNMAAFPAYTQLNLTLGAGYDFSETLGVDLAFLYAPKVTRTRTGNFVAALGGGAYSFEGTASQWALTLGARFQM